MRYLYTHGDLAYLLDLYDEGPLELHLQLLHLALHVPQTLASVYLLFKLLGTFLILPNHLQDKEKAVVGEEWRLILYQTLKQKSLVSRLYLVSAQAQTQRQHRLLSVSHTILEAIALKQCRHHETPWDKESWCSAHLLLSCNAFLHEFLVLFGFLVVMCDLLQMSCSHEQLGVGHMASIITELHASIFSQICSKK